LRPAGNPIIPRFHGMDPALMGNHTQWAPRWFQKTASVPQIPSAQVTLWQGAFSHGPPPTPCCSQDLVSEPVSRRVAATNPALFTAGTIRAIRGDSARGRRQPRIRRRVRTFRETLLGRLRNGSVCPVHEQRVAVRGVPSRHLRHGPAGHGRICGRVAAINKADTAWRGYRDGFCNLPFARFGGGTNRAPMSVDAASASAAPTCGSSVACTFCPSSRSNPPHSPRSFAIRSSG
jgi:hypothetical protein